MFQTHKGYTVMYYHLKLIIIWISSEKIDVLKYQKMQLTRVIARKIRTNIPIGMPTPAP